MSRSRAEHDNDLILPSPCRRSEGRPSDMGSSSVSMKVAYAGSTSCLAESRSDDIQSGSRRSSLTKDVKEARHSSRALDIQVSTSRSPCTFEFCDCRSAPSRRKTSARYVNVAHSSEDHVTHHRTRAHHNFVHEWLSRGASAHRVAPRGDRDTPSQI